MKISIAKKVILGLIVLNILWILWKFYNYLTWPYTIPFVDYLPNLIGFLPLLILVFSFRGITYRGNIFRYVFWRSFIASFVFGVFKIIYGIYLLRCSGEGCLARFGEAVEGVLVIVLGVILSAIVGMIISMLGKIKNEQQ